MSEEIAIFNDDSIVAIAKQAEARIDAVIKIKQIALKLTNAQDWCDQDGKPYLEGSGSEKVANAFNVSWSFLDPEPQYKEDDDGHYTYTYRGKFELGIGGRSIEVEGSRSSKDKFFNQYIYKGNQDREEKDVRDRDNKRDVKMAAMTNLLGNGITRLLGIRNLTYEDLEAFAGIKQSDVKGVKYRKPEMKEPQAKAKPETEKPEEKKEEEKALGTPYEVTTTIKDVRMKIGKNKKGKEYTLYTVKGEDADYTTFSETFASIAKEAKETNSFVLITFVSDDYGNKIETIEPFEAQEEQTAGEGDE